jgi:hypothetical protein
MNKKCFSTAVVLPADRSAAEFVRAIQPSVTGHFQSGNFKRQTKIQISATRNVKNETFRTAQKSYQFIKVYYTALMWRACCKMQT